MPWSGLRISLEGGPKLWNVHIRLSLEGFLMLLGLSVSINELRISLGGLNMSLEKTLMSQGVLIMSLEVLWMSKMTPRMVLEGLGM